VEIQIQFDSFHPIQNSQFILFISSNKRSLSSHEIVTQAFEIDRPSSGTLSSYSYELWNSTTLCLLLGARQFNQISVKKPQLKFVRYNLNNLNSN